MQDKRDKTKKKISINNKTAAVAKKDTLVYTHKSLRAEEKNCERKDGCSYVELLYPVFQMEPHLNQAVKKDVLGFLNDEKGDPNNLDQIFKDFSDVFLSDSDNTSSERMTASTLDLEITIIKQDSSLAILEFSEGMSGGAHPNENYTYMNWNTKKDHVIELKDILIGNHKATLSKIAEKIFRKNEKLSPTEPLDAYFFEKGIFTLNCNFQITPSGLSFYYNNYEIKPYSDGPTTLLIAYSQIKSLLRPNTVVSQYIK